MCAFNCFSSILFCSINFHLHSTRLMSCLVCSEFPAHYVPTFRLRGEVELVVFTIAHLTFRCYMAKWWPHKSCDFSLFFTTIVCSFSMLLLWLLFILIFFFHSTVCIQHAAVRWWTSASLIYTIDLIEFACQCQDAFVCVCVCPRVLYLHLHRTSEFDNKTFCQR